MDNREIWLTQLTDEEVRNLNPWDILTKPNAQRFLVIAGRSVLRKQSRFGLSSMTNEELLHEVYPMLCEALPGILSSCAAKIKPHNRDRFIFGSLAKLIKLRLNELVFGSSCPSERVYLEEVAPLRAIFSNGHESEAFPAYHSLMYAHDNQINAYIESHSSHEPQFLSDAERVPEQEIQNRHILIERFRPFLTTREVEVLRCLLLQHEDRSLVALEIGTTPKQVSRYRQSIQRKLRTVLTQLGWTEAEISELAPKRRESDQPSKLMIA